MVERIGRYEVQAELGRGGFGRVYRAYDPTVGRLVAIKTLNAGGDPELLTRFRNEAAAAGKLRHRNIIVIHDYGEQDSEPYIVMELLDGEDLHRRMRNRRPLSLLQKVQIMGQVAEGLDHAHRNNVVHRDVKPANIMLLPDFTVKIMDFGIAFVTQAAGSRLTKSGTVPGTLKYMAPEQFHGVADNALSDIFAYGVTFYELLCGQHPFDGQSQHAVMFNILQGEPKHPRELCAECPEALEQVVLTCLHKAPEMRYPSLGDLQLDMKPILLELQHEHAKGLLAEAERLASAGQAEGAHALLRETLEIDPGNRAARALREKVQRVLRAQMVGPRVIALLNTGRHQLESHQLDDAVSSLEAALKLDPSNADVRALLTRARQQSTPGDAVSQARAAFSEGDWTKANDLVKGALANDPSHPDGLRLQNEVDAQLDREQQRNKTEAIQRVRNALLRESFNDALMLIEQLQAAHPGAPEIAQLSEEAHAGRKKQDRNTRVTDTLSECRSLLERREYGTAIQRLEQYLLEAPHDSEVPRLLASAREQLAGQKRLEIVSRLVREVNTLVSAHNFDRAVQMLEMGLGYYPGERIIEERLSEVRAAGKLHLREKAFEQSAAAGLSQPERRSGDGTSREPVRDSQNREHNSRPDAVKTIAAQIERLLDQSQPAAAMAAAENGLAQHPGEPALQALLFRAQEQRRLRQRTEAVEKVLSQLDPLIGAQKFAAAMKLIEGGLQSFPGDAQLTRARESVLVARLAMERKQAVDEAVAEARALLDGQQLEQVIMLCQPVLDRYPDEAPLAALVSHARDQIQQRELRRRELQKIERDVKAQIESGNPDVALQLIEQGRRQFPQAASLLELFEQARRMKLRT